MITTNVIDGSSMAKVIRDEYREHFDTMKEARYMRPTLAIVSVGNDPASDVYVRNKLKACDEVGVGYRLIKLSEDTHASTVHRVIHQLNQDESITGILVQLPLPDHLDETVIVNCIDSRKDVDGFGPSHVAELYTNLSTPTTIYSCTPMGVMEMFRRMDIQIDGKFCVVVGRSNIVGKPMASMLTNAGGTVALCHSRTTNLPELLKLADIVISAVGKPKFITGNDIKEGAVVIDVGINRDENGKLCGDVDTQSCMGVASYITPVPGGVGPMTVAMLIRNCMRTQQNVNITYEPV